MLRFLTLLHLTALSLFAAEAVSPVVHVLVPGFTVQELPVKLANINNLRFAPDGRLTALGYDGRVHLLRDTDGDGLPDSDELFWDRATLSVPVGMCWGPDGLYVSSHGKVSLLRDTDRDGRADLEEIISNGWPATDVGSGGVDATAITRDAEGNLYFGLLVADYSNAYRLRKRKDLKPDERLWLEQTRGDRGGSPEEEVSLYDQGSRRGTIQKWNAQTRTLETISTGLRVPYSLAFNVRGDLFVTDQEGETWMPGGNPLDELNHIVAGSNYGFPPTHPRWLPNLHSEQPVIGFGPQHQSTCGLIFNDPKTPGNLTPGQGLFGPAHWRGDAFIAGESRGKIWRVRLAKTPYGYTGQEQIIARLDMLTTDLAISPEGDLYVSCHSGQPDWGTGPNGPGRLFRIHYAEPAAPQPLLAHATDPTHTEVLFDRPHPSTVPVPSATIQYGEFVRAADRLETLKPPYQTVQFQETTPHGKLGVLATEWGPKRDTLIVTTAPHPQTVPYALTLEAPGGTFDLDYRLQGLEVTFGPSVGQVTWKGWLPHLDLETASELTRGSASHAKLSVDLGSPGILTASANLSLPSTARRLRVEATSPFELSVQNKSVQPALAGELHRIDADLTNATWIPISFTLQVKGGSQPVIHLAYQNDGDPVWRVVPVNSFHLPWATPHEPLTMPEGLLGGFKPGDWETGRALFHGDRLTCAKCHRIRGEGTLIGPDLSNLSSRSPESVLRDIEQPSLTINPDYVSYSIDAGADGQVTGILQSVSPTDINLRLADGTNRHFPGSSLSALRPSLVSLMPAGLLNAASPGERRDLLTYLLYAPPTRTNSVTNAFAAHRFSRRLQLVLTASKQDHGPGQHDYPAWQKTWAALLRENPALDVQTAWEWPSPEQFQTADVALFYFWNHDWSAARLRQVRDFLAAGKGVILLHSACISDNDPEALAKVFGLAAQPVRTKYRHGPITLKFPPPPKAAGATTEPQSSFFYFLDESYWPMIHSTQPAEFPASAEEENARHPMIWRVDQAPGRVFGCILGHYTWTWLDPEYQRLIAEAIDWCSQGVTPK